VNKVNALGQNFAQLIRAWHLNYLKMPILAF